MGIFEFALSVMGLSMATIGLLWAGLGMLLLVHTPDIYDRRTMLPKWQSQVAEGGFLLIMGWLLMRSNLASVYQTSPLLFAVGFVCSFGITLLWCGLIFGHPHHSRGTAR